MFLRNLTIVSLLLLAVNSTFAGKNQWTTEGPFGGSFGSVVFDPRGNNLILAASGTGVFRSLNNGKTWSRTDAYGAPILIHPKQPDRILAGGGPILLSTDKGKTWQEFSSRIPFYLEQIVFHPIDPQILFAITGEHGVFKSTDGGLTWIEKNNGLDFQPGNGVLSTARIDIDKKNGKTLWVITPNGVVFKTENGGESWKSLENSISFRLRGQVIRIDPKNPKVVYAAGDRIIYKTTNGGKSWVDTKCECEANDIAIDPSNSQSLYVAACGGDAIHSIDGGKNWQNVSLGDPGCRYSAAVNPKNPNIVLLGRDSFGIERSIDGGKHWKPVVTGLDSFDTIRTEIHPERSGQIYAHNGGRLFRSNLSGKSFEPLLKDYNAFSFNLHPKDPDIIALGGDPAFLISKDGGKTVVENRDFERCPIPTCVAFHPQNPNIIYLVPQDKRDFSPVWPVLGISKSTDMGETFRLINTGLTDKKISVMSVAPQNGDVVYLGTETGKIFRTVNAGKNWINSSNGLSKNRISSVAVHPKKLDVVLASDSSGRIFKSENGGKSWNKKFELTNGFAISQVAVDPREPNVAYAGAIPYGLFVSNDEGDTWTTFNSTGLGNFSVFSFSFPIDFPATYTIGTHHGVFSFTKVAPDGKEIKETDPNITGLTPATSATGELITISGKNFGAQPGKVNFEGARGIDAESWTDTLITVIVPVEAVAGDLTLSIGKKESNGSPFIPLPASGRFQPTEGPVRGGYKITIVDSGGAAKNGSAFYINFGGKIVSPNDCTFIEEIIVCPVPEGDQAGPVPIVLHHNTLIDEEIGTFTYR